MVRQKFIEKYKTRLIPKIVSYFGPEVFYAGYQQWIAQKMATSLGQNIDHKIITQYRKNANESLAKLCDFYGSDKGEARGHGHPYCWPSHSYTDYYAQLFAHCRMGVKRVFECGIGTNNPNLPSSMGPKGRPGASLRVWRDFFPNAKIYGGDIDKGVLFEEERIKTFYLNQLDPETIKQFWADVGEGEFDFMIDDGLHTFEAGSTLFLNSIDRLSSSGVYIIEDVSEIDLIRYRSFFESKDFEVKFINLYRPLLPLGDNSLVEIRKVLPQ